MMAKPRVAKMEQIHNAYDANGAFIFSATVQTKPNGERMATITTSDKEFQMALPAPQECVPTPEAQDCDSLEACMLTGDRECYDAFYAQDCQPTPSAKKQFCLGLLRGCFDNGGAQCQAYVDNDCLGS